MTIFEAIKVVLTENTNGLTAAEIYSEIVQRSLYAFGAKNPISVVNSQIRRRCKGLNFPTAHPIKTFEIVGYQGKKPLFALIGHNVLSNEIETAELEQGFPDRLPEEEIAAALLVHYAALKQQVLEYARKHSASFFEHLVLDLLLKMGYGFDQNAGVVTGRSHDGGIDGVISEDRLGLGLIYIQAKRYAPDYKVGRKDIQAFIGAMQNVQKGVFITTSSFTKETVNFVERQQQKSIKLIDGNLLADLLVKYEVGINTVQTFSLYKIDADYYEE